MQKTQSVTTVGLQLEFSDMQSIEHHYSQSKGDNGAYRNHRVQQRLAPGSRNRKDTILFFRRLPVASMQFKLHTCNSLCRNYFFCPSTNVLFNEFLLDIAELDGHNLCLF